VRDGKLAEVWQVEQLMQMMTQMGAMGGGTYGRAQNEKGARGPLST
jgi:hypothetical protein